MMTPLPVQRRPQASSPSASQTTAASGPVVIRTETEWLAFIPDFRDGLTAFLGEVEPVSSLCDLSKPITVIPIDAQFLAKPGGAFGFLGKRNVPFYVYDVATIDFCGGELSDDHIVGSGTGRLVANDHAIEFPNPSSPPSYGYRLTGRMNLVSGGTANVSGVVKWVANPSGKVDAQSQLTVTPGK